MYRTKTVLKRELRVRYPGGQGRLVLRTELDWDRDMEPVSMADDGETSIFRLEARKPFLYFKPCLVTVDGGVHWAVGPNMLVLMTTVGARDCYPHFHGASTGSFDPVIEQDSAILGRKHLFRIYLPPGYHENTLRGYPVLYMQDGKNLFFPEDAFLGREWKVDESLGLLDSMNALDQVVVVGIYSGDRMLDYTQPGYEPYARSVVEEIVPEVVRRIRVLEGRQETGVMGSSLGGVVSFYMAWQYPEVFDVAACLSSTFAHKDDLIERVLSEPKRNTRFYLDSGWPGDNYESTLAMAVALSQRGYRYGQDLLHVAFPLAEHDEGAWSERLHLPLQLFWGKVSTANRGRFT